MNVGGVLHMVGGAGKTSYASNSKFQEKTIVECKNTIDEAIREVYRILLPKSMVVADLGCSSGPNTFLVVSEVIDAISDECQQLGRQPPEIQFFLNDLPGNDFNNIFQSLEGFKEKLKKEKAEQLVPHYVMGVPGSFYGTLFPCQSVHFFHSSFCLHWLSQVNPSQIPAGKVGPAILKEKGKVPRWPEIDASIPLNRGDIYISENSPSTVVKSYQEQFKRDFLVFLKMRYKELHTKGRMVLTFLGRTHACPSSGEHNKLWGLLAQSLNAMALEGLLKKEKVDAFNLPFYTPCMEEVKALIQSDGSFDLYQSKIFKSSWDPFDNSTDDFIVDNLRSGENVARSIRAAIEPMIACHFGETILDELFSRYAENVAKHLLKEKTKCVTFVISLKARG